MDEPGARLPSAHFRAAPPFAYQELRASAATLLEIFDRARGPNDVIHVGSGAKQSLMALGETHLFFFFENPLPDGSKTVSFSDEGT